MATSTCGECNGAGYFGRLDWGMTCSTCHGNGYINSNRAPDPLSSGSATGGTADFSPAVPPTHSNPVTAAAREASATGQGGAEVSVTAPPEPDIPAFLDRRSGP